MVLDIRLYISWWGESYYIGLMDVFGATSCMMMYVCVGTSHVMTKVYDAISHMMTEVGGGASHTMKVFGATESILINSIS